MKLLKNPGSTIGSETKAASNVSSNTRTMTDEEVKELARTSALSIAKPVLDMQAKAISEFEEAKRIYDLTPHDNTSWMSSFIDNAYSQAQTSIDDWKKKAAELGYTYN